MMAIVRFKSKMHKFEMNHNFWNIALICKLLT